MSPTNAWDPNLYEEKARFVREGGAPLIELLAPKPGERVLDLGSGAGQLTRALADAGCSVLGVDSSQAMLDEARRAYPELEFMFGHAEALAFDSEFDAVFSNACLHWVTEAESAARGMFRALRPGGRIALEFGGFENVLTLRRAVAHALAELAPESAPRAWNPWYFPRLGAYAALLESVGFTVRSALWFRRPTPMPNGEQRSGIASWLEVFASELLDSLGSVPRSEFFAAVEAYAAPRLEQDGVYWIDYTRVRVEAVRP